MVRGEGERLSCGTRRGTRKRRAPEEASHGARQVIRQTHSRRQSCADHEDWSRNLMYRRKPRVVSQKPRGGIKARVC